MRTSLEAWLAAFVVAAGGAWLAGASSASAEEAAAVCGQVRQLPDGSVVIIEVEGSHCVWDVKKDTCTCT